MNIKSKLNGASIDSVFLIFVRLVTVSVTLIMTRIVAGHFTKLEYGTYAQVSLLVSTITSLTILGMMDAVNYFYCKEKDFNKRDEYLSSIFVLQLTLNIIVSIVVFFCAVPISKYFGNSEIKNLIFFPITMPVMGNVLSLLQILFIAIGKAKLIAVRNLILCAAKLGARIVACYVFDDIFAILIFAMIFEVIQLVYFLATLRKNGLKINLFKFNKSLVKEILAYSLPMGMYVLINTFNRDIDRYVITAFTDTETLAVYTNAAKVLPFDIITSAFITVLIPHLTRAISDRNFERAKNLYKTFLEIAYVTTGIMTIAALCVAPELMEFLYTKKYLSGVGIFAIYILVDLLRFMSMTLILSASGKTKSIMYTSLCCLGVNLILNIVLFKLIGWYGPAISTLIVTTLNGFVILFLSTKALESKLKDIFNYKYLVLFVLESLAVFVAVRFFKQFICNYINNYFFLMVICAALYGVIMLAFNIKRLMKNLSLVNKNTKT